MKRRKQDGVVFLVRRGRKIDEEKMVHVFLV